MEDAKLLSEKRARQVAAESERLDRKIMHAQRDLDTQRCDFVGSVLCSVGLD